MITLLAKIFYQKVKFTVYFYTLPTRPKYNTDGMILEPSAGEGARHLRKAIDICANGGEIACILNAETIRNPYTNERKALLQELEAQEEWRYEFIEDASIDADRPTKVEIALVYVRKKKKPFFSTV